jgi:hypothetical protein
MASVDTTFTAGAAIVAHQTVYLSGTGIVQKIASTSTVPIGVAKANADTGEDLEVLLFGTEDLLVSDTVAVGDILAYKDVAGQVEAAVAGVSARLVYAVGIALTPATAGALCKALVGTFPVTIPAA